MQLFGFNPSKCKTQCRLGVGRIKLLRNKKQIAMKGLRKEVAELLRNNKQGNARIRVEAVIREHNMLQAFEILELYLELIAVRADLLAKSREIPNDMVEAVCSLIYAGERVQTDLAEIAAVAKLLVGKYTSVYKDAGFPQEVVSDCYTRKWQVNENLVRMLAVTAPSPEDKLKVLDEIAQEHGVEFNKDAAALDMLPAAGQPLPMQPYAAPVETLAAGGAVPLAQGWQPPAAGVVPPAVPAQQPGWQPPAGDSAAAGHYSRVLSGGTVVHRPAAPEAPGATAQPSAAAAAAAATQQQGWQPPKPEDVDKHGRAFQAHVGSAAAWKQVKLHGASSGGAALDPAAGAGAQAYPPPAAALADLPGTAQSSGQSTPSVADKPITPGSSYADASAAAEAAKRYSQMAAQAAQRAEEYAAAQARAGASPGPGSPGPGSPGGPGGSGGKFVQRSSSEIQRAYDAAPGPPSKADKEGGPPSAPTAPTADDASAASGASTSGAGGGQELDASFLPSVPAAGVPPPPSVGDELDELTRRFEALKRR